MADMFKTLLIVEDDPLQREQLEDLFAEAGYFTAAAASVAEAERLLKGGNISLLLLDLRLGDESGMDILALVRRAGSGLPVVVLSSAADIRDKISALEIGADDYVTKPYHPAELLLRVKRRLKTDTEDEKPIRRLIRIGAVELDVVNGIVKRDNRQFFLRKKLLDLLCYLNENREQLVSRDQIRAAVWKDELIDENLISVSIHELRKIVERNPKAPKLLKTVKGLGYRLTVR